MEEVSLYQGRAPASELQELEYRILTTGCTHWQHALHLELGLGRLLCSASLLVNLDGPRVGTLTEENDLYGDVVAKHTSG